MPKSACAFAWISAGMPVCSTCVGGPAACPASCTGRMNVFAETCVACLGMSGTQYLSVIVYPHVFPHVCQYVGLSYLPCRREALSHVPTGTLGSDVKTSSA